MIVSKQIGTLWQVEAVDAGDTRAMLAVYNLPQSIFKDPADARQAARVASDWAYGQASFPAEKNDPRKAGQKAGAVMSFGEFGRFRIFPVHTRFDAVSWFVTDAEVIDEETGFASVIRQEPTFQQAIDGLF